MNPKERRIVVVESILAPSLFRDTLAKVLFTHYEVSLTLFPLKIRNKGKICLDVCDVGDKLSFFRSKIFLLFSEQKLERFAWDNGKF